VRRRLTALLLFAALPLCWQPAVATELQLASPAFAHGEMIPEIYTCEGADQPPPLHWHGIPAGANSLALIMEDPDAPDPAAPRMLWVHWVVYNLPVHATGLQEAEIHSGVNSWGKRGYGGPCPPIGEHRYFFRLYALDRTLPQHAYQRQQLLAIMKGHILATATLMGRYRKRH